MLACPGRLSTRGPANSSNRATAARRATEIVLRFIRFQGIASRSSASVKTPLMSAGSVVKKYLGYSSHRSRSNCQRTTVNGATSVGMDQNMEECLGMQIDDLLKPVGQLDLSPVFRSDRCCGNGHGQRLE